MYYVKLSVSSIALGKKVTVITGITQKMSASRYFIAGADLIATANTAAAELQTAQTNAYKAGPALTQVMYAKAVVADNALFSLALLVDGIAIDNPTEAEQIVTAAGMEMRTRTLPNIPTLSVKQGSEANSVILRRKAEKGSSYQWQKSSDIAVEANWTEMKMTTVAKFTATGLTSGQRYWFRVSTVKGTEKSDWTDPVTVVVQ